MAKKSATPEDVQARREFDLRDKLKSFVPYPPESRLFKVGDIVTYGCHPNCEIIAVHDSGRVYEIRTWGDYKEYSNIVFRENFSFVTWDCLISIASSMCKTDFVQNTDIWISYSNMMIDSLINTYYFSGIDMNPIYQRDYVWTLEDQVALIDSIFCNRAIGSYILCFNGYSSKCLFEILDGKQRIKAIIDFIEDKFRYNGKLYSELSNRDRNHFDNVHFPRADVEASTIDQKIKIFIHVNSTGRHMDINHIEKVKGMLNE